MSINTLHKGDDDDDNDNNNNNNNNNKEQQQQQKPVYTIKNLFLKVFYYWKESDVGITDMHNPYNSQVK